MLLVKKKYFSVFVSYILYLKIMTKNIFNHTNVKRVTTISEKCQRYNVSCRKDYHF